MGACDLNNQTKLQGAQMLEFEATVKIGLERSVPSGVILFNDEIINVIKDHQKTNALMKCDNEQST